jgi:O-methyltransferase
VALVRRGPGTLYRRLQSVRFLLGRDRAAVLAFLAARYPIRLSRVRRLDLVRRFVTITNHVRSYHQQAELLTVADRVLARAGRPGLTVVECGVGKGGSTAKLSLVARLAGARLVVFDSFRGVPPNSERHTDLLGRRMTFREGAFRGRLREVQRTVERFGAPAVVEYRKGWFADTLPGFDAAVDVALVDVDLLASTRTCLVHLVPRLRAGGVLFSQDGHLRATVDLLGRDAFWRDEVGVPRPAIRGLGGVKLLEIAGHAPSAEPAAGRLASSSACAARACSP